MHGWGVSTRTDSLSTVSLATIAVAASALAGHTTNPLTSIFEILVVLAAVLALRHLLNPPDRLRRLGSATLRLADGPRGRSATLGTVQLAQLLDVLVLDWPRGRDWLHARRWASWDRIADVLCPIAACLAIGAHGLAIAGAAAYSLGVATPSIPLPPAGLGVANGTTLILALRHSHLTPPPRRPGVLLYRLIGVVVIAARGWAIWLALPTGTRQPATINLPAAVQDAS